jgi:hypothetical protein
VFLFGAFFSMTLSASDELDKKICPNLSGNYVFNGQWEVFEADGPNSESIRKSVMETPPRFDERALSFVARSVIDPQVVVLKHNLAGNLLVVDIIGTGVDQQWKHTGRLILPAELSLVCIGGRLLRKEISHGSDGFASSELSDQIFLSVEAGNYLRAEGERSITSGLIFKKKLTMRWEARFKNKVNIVNGVVNGVRLH